MVSDVLCMPSSPGLWIVIFRDHNQQSGSQSRALRLKEDVWNQKCGNKKEGFQLICILLHPAPGLESGLHIHIIYSIGSVFIYLYIWLDLQENILIIQYRKIRMFFQIKINTSKVHIHTLHCLEWKKSYKKRQRLRCYLLKYPLCEMKASCDMLM